MPPGWMHITVDGDPLLNQLRERMPADLTEEQRDEVLATVVADEDLLRDVIDDFNRSLLAQVPDTVAYVENQRSAFARRLRWAWAAPFDHYLATHHYIESLGEEFNTTYRAASHLPEPLLEAMTRNLARACLTSIEVFSLLEAGHRHGALARARTLHELDVVSLTLALHPELAEPYLLHHHVERYQLAQIQHEARVAQGAEGMSNDELDALRTRAEELGDRFGPRYRQPWGWAAPILGGGRGFGALFKKVTADQTNPDFKLSSHFVHAGSLGGELSTTTTASGTILDTGPDFPGLAEPYALALGSLAAIALRTVESATGAQMTEHGTIALGAIAQMADEAIELAWAAEEVMDDLGQTFPPESFGRRRTRWTFVIMRELRFARWRARRATRARTERPRRALRDIRRARPSWSKPERRGQAE